MNPSPSLFSSKNAKLNNIVLESLDAAFNICNSNLYQFTIAKLFDVFDQIFPTASVLNTGYWIFFASNNGASLCICGRFGIVCRHVGSKNHWIDLQPMVERNGATVFKPKIYGPVIPRECQVNLNYATDIFGYVIDVDIVLTYANMCKTTERVHFQARYGYLNQWYRGLHSISFTPHTIFKEHYGKYFTKLRQYKAMVLNNLSGYQDLIINPTTMSPSCLVLSAVNFAKFEAPSNISASVMCYEEWLHWDVATQTNGYEECIDYGIMLHDVTCKIWGHPNTDQNEPLIGEQINQNALPYPGNDNPEYPIGITRQDEYDVEFPDFIKKQIHL